MFLHRDPDSGAIVLSSVDEPILDLLQRIVPSADPGGDRNALDRLYSSPTAGADPDFDDEWRDLVGSGLREEFASAQDVVLRDLAAITNVPGMDGQEIRIAADHLDAWVNTLNQARLALAARHNFTDRDIESGPTENHPHAFPLLQIHIYGILQERFIHELTK
jgi:hypothetical protein